MNSGHRTAEISEDYAICVMCGFHSTDKYEVLVHMGQFHTISQAEEFSYDKLYSIICKHQDKRIFDHKCLETGLPISLEEMISHRCKYTTLAVEDFESDDPDADIKMCEDPFSRLHAALNEVTYAFGDVKNRTTFVPSDKELSRLNKTLEKFEMAGYVAKRTSMQYRRRYNTHWPVLVQRH